MFFKKNGTKFGKRLFKTCTSPFQEGLRMYWSQKVVQHNIDKEMCTVSKVFPLFCPTLHVCTTWALRIRRGASNDQAGPTATPWPHQFLLPAGRCETITKKTAVFWDVTPYSQVSVDISNKCADSYPKKMDATCSSVTPVNIYLVYRGSRPRRWGTVRVTRGHNANHLRDWKIQCEECLIQLTLFYIFKALFIC
jgi:hypothetical protein